MNDYKALVEEAREYVMPFSDPVEFVLVFDLADAVEDLITLRDELNLARVAAEQRAVQALLGYDEAVERLAVSRARFADSEARRVELEAVMAKARGWLNGEILYSHNQWAELFTAPSTVLGEHDQEVAARAWDEAVAAVAWATAEGPDPIGYVASHNPYRKDSKEEN